MNSNNHPAALVVYQHLPHYRYGVFSELQNSHEITFAFASDTISQEGNIALIPLEAINHHIRLRNLWFGPILWQRGLLTTVAFGNYDAFVFLGDWRYASTWLAASVARLRRKRVLFWTIGWHRLDSGLRRWVRNRFYCLGNRVLVYAPRGAALGAASGFSRGRLTVIGNSSSEVPADTGTGDASRIGQHNTSPIIAVVRLNSSKRLDLLLRAVAQISEEHRPSVTLVGDGPEKENLAQLAKSLGVLLWMPGPIHDRESLAQFYANALVCVIPEAAGLTVIQSLRYGVPVVTCDRPDLQMPEYEAVIDGVNGSLYAAGDVQALTEAISRWLDPSVDRAAVAVECRASLEALWTVEANGRNVLKAVLGEVSNGHR